MLPFGSAHEEREGWELRGSYDHVAAKDVLDKTDTERSLHASWTAHEYQGGARAQKKHKVPFRRDGLERPIGGETDSTSPWS